MKSWLLALLALLLCTDCFAQAQPTCSPRAKYHGLAAGKATLDAVVAALGQPRGLHVGDRRQIYTFGRATVSIRDADGVVDAIRIRDQAHRDLHGFNLHSAYARIAAHAGITKEGPDLLDRENGISYRFKIGVVGRKMTEIVYSVPAGCGLP